MDKIAGYRLVRSLGEGNHGEFFLAERPSRLPGDSEFVAVKVLASMSNEDAVRRITRELQHFASITSPYLVSLYDAGQEGGRFFYSMEYFPLGSLARPARPLDRAERLRAVADAARAAHTLHEGGAVHRGIKPTNIMMHEAGGKLSDLGLTQLLSPGQKLTATGPIGSVEYMDPEMLRTEQGSRGTDVWSLGVTLHRVLSGVGVYGELPDDPYVVVVRVLNTTPTLSENLSDGERGVISRALAPRALDRHHTALELADEIDALV